MAACKPTFVGVHRNDFGVQVSVRGLTVEQSKMLSMVLENRAKRFVKMLNMDFNGLKK